jgi:hypothetical protein
MVNGTNTLRPLRVVAKIRLHERRDCAGPLCTKSSNNNRRGFYGFLKVGCARFFLKSSRRKDPIGRFGLSVGVSFTPALPPQPVRARLARMLS